MESLLLCRNGVIQNLRLYLGSKLCHFYLFNTHVYYHFYNILLSQKQSIYGHFPTPTQQYPLDALKIYPPTLDDIQVRDNSKPIFGAGRNPGF